MTTRSTAENMPNRSARRRFGGIVAAALGGVALLASTMATGVAGSADGPTLTISPTSGPVGTVVSVTGTCTPTVGTPTIQMQQGDVNVFIISRDVQLTSDGHLSGTIVIPASHLISPLSPDLTVPVEPGDAFTVAATCDATGRDYFTAPDAFVVTEPPATTSTSTTSTPTTSTTSAPATTVTTMPTTTIPTMPTSSTTTPATGEPTVNTSQGSVGVGGSVTVSGDGFAPVTALDIELHSTPVHLGSTTSRADGTYSATVTIPAGTTPGVHAIVVSGRGIDGAMRQVTATITVSARAATPDTKAPGTRAPGTRAPVQSARAASAVSSTPTFTG